MNPHIPAAQAGAELDLMARGSLPKAWSELARNDPQHPTVHDPAQGWLSRADLSDLSATFAGRLYGAGLRTGDRVLISAKASASMVAAHMAALRLGLVVVPVNGAYSEPEVGHILSDCEPRAAIVDDPQWIEWIHRLDRGILVTEPQLPLDDSEPPSLDLASPQAPALIGYTSGTTGRPKGAVLTHANLLAGAESVLLAWRWTAADRLVLALPLFHMHGLGVGLHGTLLAGGSAVIIPEFSPDAVFDAVKAHEATLFFGVPTMYSRLAASPRIPELGALRLCVSGSAPLPASLHKRLVELSGQRVLERYGMTETVMLVSNPHDEERRPGTVGFPLPGVEMRLDVDSNEIEVRGPNVFNAYWRQPDATRDAFNETWFRTGDIGAFDSDGYLSLVGRAKDLIITGGYNVYPREVEDVLLTHPAISEVVVAGSPDEEWGELVTAFIVPAENDAATPPTLEELREYCRGRLAPFKQPRRVETISETPRNALGKVQRHLLPTLDD